MKNTFALTPDDKPPRVIRFVSNIGANNVLSVLDDKRNVLFIYKKLYDTLDDLNKNRVQRTHAASITLHDHVLVEHEYEFQPIPIPAHEAAE